MPFPVLEAAADLVHHAGVVPRVEAAGVVLRVEAAGVVARDVEAA